MFRELERRALPDYGFYIRAACLSTDTKKELSGYATGSLCHEVDTKKVYAYNEAGAAGSKWVEQIELSESEG